MQADVAVHALVVVGLLHHHFHLGLHIPAALLHAAESCGLALAVVSTLAAAGAELLAMRRALLPRATLPTAGGNTTAAELMAQPDRASSRDKL